MEFTPIIVPLTNEGKKALAKVAEWLEDGAPHVRVSEEGRRLDNFDMEYGVIHNNSCGTSCCVAGAICQFEGLGSLKGNDLPFFGDNGASKYATMLLLGKVYPDETFSGISGPKDLDALFCPWLYFEPKDGDNDCAAYSNTSDAAKVIRHYIATNEINWEITGKFKHTY